MSEAFALDPFAHDLSSTAAMMAACDYPSRLVANGWEILEQYDIAYGPTVEEVDSRTRLGWLMNRGIGLGVGLAATALSRSCLEHHTYRYLDLDFSKDGTPIHHQAAAIISDAITEPYPLLAEVGPDVMGWVRFRSVPMLGIYEPSQIRIVEASALYGHKVVRTAFNHWLEQDYDFDTEIMQIIDNS